MTIGCLLVFIGLDGAGIVGWSGGVEGMGAVKLAMTFWRSRDQRQGLAPHT